MQNDPEIDDKDKVIGSGPLKPTKFELLSDFLRKRQWLIVFISIPIGLVLWYFMSTVFLLRGL